MYPKWTMNLSVVAGRLAGAALANRVPLDHHELPVEVGEHAQALIDELFASQRFALAIEQNRITFDLGQCKVRFIRGDMSSSSSVMMWAA